MSAGFWIRRKKAAAKKAKEVALKAETTAKTTVPEAEKGDTPVETPKKVKKGGVKSEKGTD